MMAKLQPEHPWAQVSEQEGALYCMCRFCSSVAAEPNQPAAWQGLKQATFGIAPGIKLKDDQRSITRQLRQHARQDKHVKAGETFCSDTRADDASSSAETGEKNGSAAAVADLMVLPEVTMAAEV